MATLGIHESEEELPLEPTPVRRPDVTPIQWTAIVGAVVQFARAFGIWDASPEQEDALNVACGMLGVLVLGDTGLRIGRNLGNR